MNLSTYSSRHAQRWAALAIAATMTLILVALSHHPVGAADPSLQRQLAHLATLQRQLGLVHGVIIVLLVVLAAAFTVFSATLGQRRPAVQFSNAAYRAGCALMVLAMLLDGYVTPQVAAAFGDGPTGDVPFVYLLLRCVAVVIQVLTKAGFLAMCVAFLGWSCALMVDRAHRPWSYVASAAGLLAAVLPAGVILGADLQLVPASLMALFATHALWNLAAALLLYRASLAHPADSAGAAASASDGTVTGSAAAG